MFGDFGKKMSSAISSPAWKNSAFLKAHCLRFC
jgi:hypothetical protein